jgi:hypothetical protein
MLVPVGKPTRGSIHARQNGMRFPPEPGYLVLVRDLGDAV